MLDVCLEEFFWQQVEVWTWKRYGFSFLLVPFPRDHLRFSIFRLKTRVVSPLHVPVTSSHWIIGLLYLLVENWGYNVFSWFLCVYMYVWNYVTYVDVFWKCNYVHLGVLPCLLVTVYKLNSMLVLLISCTHGIWIVMFIWYEMWLIWVIISWLNESLKMHQNFLHALWNSDKS